MKYPGHQHDQNFISKSLIPAPYEFKKHILSKYKHVYESQGRSNANLDLMGINHTLKTSSIKLASSDDDIRKKASACAIRCSKIIAGGGLFNGCAYAKDMGIKLPRSKTDTGKIARLSCEYWWRRALRKKHGRTVEGLALDLTIVNKHKEIYASNASLNRRRNQKSRNRAILEECLAVNELGDSFTLQELADLSVSNPKLRRMELMTRIAGFEEHANSNNMVGEFYTFTCPSRYHSSLSKTGKRNPKYDGSTPREGQKYLSVLWQRIRAKLHRENIQIYGFRVCEPQQDGTPHWHLLIFVKPEEKQELRSICRHYNLQESPNEPGAQKHRFTVIAIDPKRGSAAGYIAKYIAKNIDGFAVDQDLFGNDANLAAERVDAWASTWGIRQFQQVGGPSVTVWRELRRIGEDCPEEIAEAHTAADTGNWRHYCEVMERLPLSLAKQGPVNEETGEIKLNRYLEPAGEVITGLKIFDKEILTRVHTWEIKSNVGNNESKKCNIGGTHTSSGNDKESRRGECSSRSSSNRSSSNGRGCISSCGNGNDLQQGGEQGERNPIKLISLRDAIAAPWSSVNNCTQVQQIEKIINQNGGDSP